MKFRSTVSLDQPLLLPPRPDEWLPAGHMARVVATAVDTLDFKCGRSCRARSGTRSLRIFPETSPPGDDLWLVDASF